jgi:hypothetical protein
VVRILPKGPGKEALNFEVRHLELKPLDLAQAMSYGLDMTNPKPPGAAHVSGSIGPWKSGDPGATPASGEYQFQNADLGIFQALRGTLSSHGRFAGTLSDLEVTGDVEVPNFTRIGEHPLPLHADFRATVDGMNGNTLLHPANVHLVHSTIVANGGIVSKPGEQGKTVTLDATVQPGRIDDFLLLMMKPKEPFMAGATLMQAHIMVPPVSRPFLEKLHVTGTVTIGSAHYNRPKVQANVDRLSKSAEGEPKDDPELVDSEVRGQCVIDGGVVHVSTLSLQVPGAFARTKGTYALKGHALHLTGTLRTEAKASQTTTGWKSALLKVVDPFLKRKHAGAEIPIQVTGTSDHPNFSVRKIP